MPAGPERSADPRLDGVEVQRTRAALRWVRRVELVSLPRSRQRLLRRIRTRRGREAEGVVLVEGPRVLDAALRHGAEVVFALVDDTVDPDDGASASGRAVAGLRETGAEVVHVSTEELDALADTRTPQGILAIVREPEASLPDPSRAADLAPLLILDALQDPGNVGTLLRVSAAFGVRSAFALDGTVDVWNPKVVRASAGHVFGIAVHRLSWGDAEPWLREAGLELRVGDAHGVDLRDWSGPAQDRWALLVGNEAAGPRQEALAAADVRIAVPMAGNVDSLNAAVAGAVLLWALGPGRDRAPRSKDLNSERMGEMKEASS